MSTVEVRVPDMGNFDSVSVIDVLVKPGDSIDIDTPLATADNRSHACESWPTPEAIGVRALKLIDQLEPVPARAIVRFPGTPEPPPTPREASPRGEVRALLDAVLSPAQSKEISR